MTSHEHCSNSIAFIKLTGVDTVGKSTLARTLAALGFSIHHSSYHPELSKLAGHYGALLDFTSRSGRWVLDRGFITEHVYGPVLRGYSKLSDSEFQWLLRKFAESHGHVFYLSEDEQLIRSRLRDSVAEFPRHAAVLQHLDDLFQRYEVVLRLTAKFVPVAAIQPSRNAPGTLPLEVAEAIGSTYDRTNSYEGSTGG